MLCCSCAPWPCFALQDLGALCTAAVLLCHSTLTRCLMLLNRMFCNSLVAHALVAAGRYVCVGTLCGPVKGGCAAARLCKPIMLVKDGYATARTSITGRTYSGTNSCSSTLDHTQSSSIERLPGA